MNVCHQTRARYTLGHKFNSNYGSMPSTIIPTALMLTNCLLDAMLDASNFKYVNSSEIRAQDIFQLYGNSKL